MNTKGYILLLTLPLLALWAGACWSEDCEKGDCSGYGTCELVSGEVTCVCDIGFEAQGRECVAQAACLEMGMPCQHSESCCDSWCLKFGDDDLGYCSTHGCETNYDCVNHAEDGDMCCVDVGGEFYICMKIAPGFACATEITCGYHCEDQTYCPPHLKCIHSEDGGSFCSQRCSTDSDCASCENTTDPDATYDCLPLGSEGTYCQKHVEFTCTREADCLAGETCFPYPSPDGTAIEGKCGSLGDLPAGAACDGEADPNDLPAAQRCQAFYCLDDRCSAVCAQDEDCPEGMLCRALSFCMDDPCETTAYIGLCWDRSCCPPNRETGDGGAKEGWWSFSFRTLASLRPAIVRPSIVPQVDRLPWRR